MGLCSAINEMLLFSVQGQISILPALPEKWRKGKVKGMLARGGIEVSIEWDVDENHYKVELLSKNIDCEIEVLLPHFVKCKESFKANSGRKVKKVALKAGKPMLII